MWNGIFNFDIGRGWQAQQKMDAFRDFSLSLLSFKAEIPPQKSAFFYEMCISVCK